jgi:hypothetical protein
MFTRTPTFAPDTSTGINGHDKAPRRGKSKWPKHAKPVKVTKAKGKAKAKIAHSTDPAKLDQFGLRRDSLKSKAASLYSTKRGATLNEIKAKLKSTQFNVLKQLREAGYKIKEAKEAGNGNREVTRYFLQA